MDFKNLDIKDLTSKIPDSAADKVEDVVRTAVDKIGDKVHLSEDKEKKIADIIIDKTGLDDKAAKAKKKK